MTEPFVPVAAGVRESAAIAEAAQATTAGVGNDLGALQAIQLNFGVSPKAMHEQRAVLNRKASHHGRNHGEQANHRHQDGKPDTGTKLAQRGHKEPVKDADTEADQRHQSRTPFQTRAPTGP
jgi:hypothetical protein